MHTYMYIYVYMYMFLHKSPAHEATIPEFLQKRYIKNTKET